MLFVLVEIFNLGGGNLLNWWWFIIFGEFFIFLVENLLFWLKSIFRTFIHLWRVNHPSKGEWIERVNLIRVNRGGIALLKGDQLNDFKRGNFFLNIYLIIPINVNYFINFFIISPCSAPTCWSIKLSSISFIPNTKR